MQKQKKCTSIISGEKELPIFTTMKASMFIEYQGLQIEEKDILAKIKELWVKDGNKIKDIKELKMYVKPEEFAAYYVINDDKSGKIDLK